VTDVSKIGLWRARFEQISGWQRKLVFESTPKMAQLSDENQGGIGWLAWVAMMIAIQVIRAVL
jgi:hypothetical protein